METLEPSKIYEEISHINKQLYEKNFELETLRKLYQIISTSDELEDVAEKLITSIVKSLNCNLGAIFLKDSKNKFITTLAITNIEQISNLELMNIYNAIKLLNVPLSETNNLLVQIINSETTPDNVITQNLSSILGNRVDTNKCKEFQISANIDKIIISQVVIGMTEKCLFLLGVNEKSNKLILNNPEILNEIRKLVGIGIDKSKNFTDLKEANIKLKKLDQMKDELVAITSHELKTPLSIIKNSLFMALNETNKPDQASNSIPVKDEDKISPYLKIALQSANEVLQLVSSILTVSKIEGGHFNIEKKNENMADLINKIIEELTPKADRKHNKLVFNQTMDINANIDIRYVHEIIYNLIDNAIKYSYENTDINIFLRRENNKIVIPVNNKGNVIQPEDFNKLFTKFGKLDSGKNFTGSKSGTGLGLYICKKFAESHGGDILVESTQEKGTTFTVLLPGE